MCLNIYMYVMIIAQQDKALNSVIVDNTFR